MSGWSGEAYRACVINLHRERLIYMSLLALALGALILCGLLFLWYDDKHR
jgi:hypothetical protein